MLLHNCLVYTVCVSFSDSKVPVVARGSTEVTNSSVGLKSVLLDQPEPPTSTSPPVQLAAPSHNGKKTTFATLPHTTTTWQQQQANHQLQTDTSFDTGNAIFTSFTFIQLQSYLNGCND